MRSKVRFQDHLFGVVETLRMFPQAEICVEQFVSSAKS